MIHTYRRTRFPELGYDKLTTNIWRIVDTSTHSHVGPIYRSKSELLADLQHYAAEFTGQQP